MRRHLFLTGDMGAGKSTAIASALGDRLPTLGGFLTRRIQGTDGKAICFALARPDGHEAQIFLDVSTGSPVVRMEAFETLGISALEGDALVLDEIGGVELLSPAFTEALEKVLRSDVPILGVLKGKAASQVLANTLGLGEEYRQKADDLWNALLVDDDTQIYFCEKYDAAAVTLAAQWVQEYGL